MVKITGSDFQRSCPEFMKEISSGKIGVVEAYNGRGADRAVRAFQLTLTKGVLDSPTVVGSSRSLFTLEDGEVKTSVSMRDLKGIGVKGALRMINQGVEYAHYRPDHKSGMKVFKVESLTPMDSDEFIESLKRNPKPKPTRKRQLIEDWRLLVNDFRQIDWDGLQEMGLIERINKEVLNPVGLCVESQSKKSKCIALIKETKEKAETTDV